MTGCSSATPGAPVAGADTLTTDRRPVPVTVIAAQRVTLQESIKLVGALSAKRKAVVSSGLAGRVTAVLVREGDAVQTGQVLARLDDNEARLRLIAAEGNGILAARQAEEALHQAQAHEAQAQSELEQTRSATDAGIRAADARVLTAQAKLRLLLAGPRPQEIERARADVEGAQADLAAAQSYTAYTERTLKRKRLLLDKGYISQQEIDTAEQEYHRAQNGVQAQQSQLRGLQQTVKILEAGARREEIEQMQAEVTEATANLHAAQAESERVKQRQQELTAARAETQRAKAALGAAHYDGVGTGLTGTPNVAQATIQLAQEELAHTVIRAPISGIVTARHAEPGDVVQSGVALLELQDPGSPALNMTLADHDAARVQPGQTVSISIDGALPQTLTGTVRALIPPSATNGGVFQVSVALPSAAGLLRPGALVTGRIVTAALQNTLAIPLSALLTEKAPHGEVYVMNKGRAYRRKVQLGVEVAGQVAVTSGLEAGEQVVTANQSLLRDGSPVDTHQP